MFDFAFSTSIADIDSVPPGIFSDFFAVSLYTTDESCFLDILVVDVQGAVPDPSDGIESITSVLPVDVDLDGFVEQIGTISISEG